MESHIDTREYASADDGTTYLSPYWPFMALRFIFIRSPYLTGVFVENSQTPQLTSERPRPRIVVG